MRPVNEVSLRIAAGESLGLVGESGSGKTMLSLALMGLLPPGARISGDVSLGTEGCPKKLTALTEREWRDVRGGKIAMVFQEPMTSLNPVMRIGRNWKPTTCNAERSMLYGAPRFPNPTHARNNFRTSFPEASGSAP